MPFDRLSPAASQPGRPDPTQLTAALKEVYLDGQRLAGTAIGTVTARNPAATLHGVREMALIAARIIDNLTAAADLLEAGQ